MKNDFFTYSCRKIEKDKAIGRCDVEQPWCGTQMPVQILRQRRIDVRRAVTRNDDTVQRMVKSQWAQGINRSPLFIPDSYPLQRSGEGSHSPTYAVAEWHKVALAIQTEVRVAYGGRIA